MARKKLTPNQQAYQKQRKRLQQSKYYIQKKGYYFESDPVPPMPKRVTQKALQEISEMKSHHLYPMAKAIHKETGEILSGTLARRLERKQSTKIRRQAQIKARRRKRLTPQGGTPISPPETVSEGGTPIQNFSKQIVANAISEILHMPPEIADRLVGLIKQLVHYNGEDAVAQALMDMPGEFHYYLQLYKYDSDAAAEGFASDLINYLPDTTDQFKADLLDAFEYHETGYVIE